MNFRLKVNQLAISQMLIDVDYEVKSTEEQIQLVARAGIEVRASGLQVQCL